MRPTGAFTSNELLSDGTEIPIVFPVTPNLEFSLPSLVSVAGYDKLEPNQTPSFKRTDIGPRVPLVMEDLSTGDGAGFNVMSQPCYRRAVTGSAPNVTISRRSSAIVTGAIFGGAFVACLAVLLLLSLPFYLKRRGRNPQSTHTDDLENGVSGQTSPVSSGDGPVGL
ncbi:hypothetical protein BJV74DRAFT_594596 [Russula compacta]|nr:hypothetical protein BJV74DRAFT_594596 [Russula compacta]